MNTKQLLAYSILATLTTPAFADITTTTDPTVFFDKDPQVKPDLLLNQPKIATPTVAPVATDNTLEARINAAIMGKDWAQLEQLLKQYHQVADKDQTLYDYGLGALYRHQGNKNKQLLYTVRF